MTISVSFNFNQTLKKGLYQLELYYNIIVRNIPAQIHSAIIIYQYLSQCQIPPKLILPDFILVFHQYSGVVMGS